MTAANSSGSDGETKTNYITVTTPQPPVANFTTSTTNPPVGGSVTFTDTSTNTPTSWSWIFEGGTPGSSTAQNPTVTYNTVGTFDVSLTATNAQGNNTKTEVDYINVSAIPYCTSQGNNYSYEWIAGVQVGTMNNTSGDAGYTDFTSITCDLDGGSTVNVALTPGFSGSTYTEYWKIWIDYNDDHDFEDAGEEVFSGSGSSVVNGSFTAPSVSYCGTRMRVSMKYASYPLPCETFSYGEVEDYTLYVTPTSPPTATATYTVGYKEVFTEISTSDYRRAQPVTMPEDGVINSVSMYHTAGNGERVILAVYDGEGAPLNKIAETCETLVSTSTCTNWLWQEINLESPVFVKGGTTIWLAWVYENIEGTNTGIRYQNGTPGRYQSPETWLGGMPDLFGTGTQDDYIYTIYATYTPTSIVGYSEEFTETSDSDSRCAQPFTMPEDGTIRSISMYHAAGNGSDHMILAVYDGESSPQDKIAVTCETLVSTSTCDDWLWQEIELASPVFVESGTTIWLAWVYESIEETTTGIRFQSGTPGRYQSSGTWNSNPRMPDPFGSGTQADYIYSIYASYTPTPISIAGYSEVFSEISTSDYRRAQPVTTPEDGTIRSISMYHAAGNGRDHMILAVYDDEGSQQNRIGITAETLVAEIEDWQTIDLISPVPVTCGQTIWLAWVYEGIEETTTLIRYQSGTPGRYQSSGTWNSNPRMPDPFESGTQANFIYSIYATYTVD